MDNSLGRGAALRLLYLEDLDGSDRLRRGGVSVSYRSTGGPMAAPVRAQILVVDDEPVIRQLLKEMLLTMGYQVEIAASGHEALTIYNARKGEIDLVILDVMMPGMSGIEVFRRLKKLDPNVRVILASGYVDASKLQMAMKEGVQDFIAKPFAIRTLHRKIEAILSK